MIRQVIVCSGIFGFILSLAKASPGEGRLPEIERSSEILKVWNGKLDAAVILVDPNEKFEEIGKVLRGVGEYEKYSKRYNTKEFAQLLAIAQRSIIGIQGHAEYFERKIKDLQSKLENASKDQKWMYANDYKKLQSEAFTTLGLLPSPESVKVLGGFLADEKGGIDLSEIAGDEPTPGEATTAQSKNCLAAAEALSRLIEGPPVQDTGKFQYYAYKTWALWYEQIRAGNRTFRFYGDPVEYDLNGPAHEEKLLRVGRDRKRDEERAVGIKKSSSTYATEAASTQVSKPSSIAWLVAAIVFCIAAIWHFMKNRKSV